MPVDLAALRSDLAAEQASLDDVVAGQPAAAWATPTPAEPWTVHDQVAHLTYFDDRAMVAASDPERFQVELARELEDPDVLFDGHLRDGRAMSPEALLADWRGGRAKLLDALAAVDPGARISWYGPPMSVGSFTSARLMECWAHGQDVLDALGVERPGTARLRHIAHLAIGARAFSYTVRGRAVPDGAVHVALDAPDGTTWTWGDPGLPDRVTGDAADFCLVTTQRRHLDDTWLRVEGPLAADWMSIAQAFAGPAGPGRRSGQFPRRSVASRS